MGKGKPQGEGYKWLMAVHRYAGACYGNNGASGGFSSLPPAKPEAGPHAGMESRQECGRGECCPPPKVGVSAVEGTALAPASPLPRWDRGPRAGELGRRRLKRGVKVWLRRSCLGLILPMMLFHRCEPSTARNSGALHQLCAGGCKAVENQAPFV